jgi:hypothetical protein
MGFHDLCKQRQFKPTPSLYFNPQELDKELGDYTFLIQFIDGDYPPKTQYKKTYWAAVI